jgi:hypothetical protein
MRGNARDLNHHKLQPLNLKKILVKARILLLSATSTMILCVEQMAKHTAINVISTKRLTRAYAILREDLLDDLSLLRMAAPVWLSQSDLMMVRKVDSISWYISRLLPRTLFLLQN